MSSSRNFGFLIGRVVVLRSHFTQPIRRHFSTLDKSTLEKSLNEIIEYKEGNELIAKGQYDAASNRLDRVIEILELSQQQKNPIYAHLLEKSGSVLLKREGQSKRIEEISSKLSGVLQEAQGKRAELATRNAFLAALNFDLQKASEHLGKLTSIPEYQLFQASLQILQGQSEPAISTLNSLVQRLEAEEQNPSNDKTDLLYSALNNLGVARWQDEYPQFNHLNVVGGDNLQRKSPDFQNALIFKRALLVKNSTMKDNKVFGLFANSKDAVAPTENIPNMDFYFNEKGSDIALRAICDYLFDAHLTKRLEHTVWTKFYLKHYEMNEKQYIYRPLMSIAHHCGVSHMLLKSEGLFNTAISMLQDNKTIEKPMCNYFFANTVAQIDKREEEAEQIKAAARKEIQEKFPAWGQWKLYLALPQPKFEE